MNNHMLSYQFDVYHIGLYGTRTCDPVSLETNFLLKFNFQKSFCEKFDLIFILYPWTTMYITIDNIKKSYNIMVTLINYITQP